MPSTCVVYHFDFVTKFEHSPTGFNGMIPEKYKGYKNQTLSLPRRGTPPPWPEEVVDLGVRKLPPRLGGLGYVRCLGAFLPLRDFKFDLVALLQTLVALRGYCAVVHKHVRLPIVATDEPVPFRVVEPLHRAFQTFHVRPLVLRIPPETVEEFQATAKYAGIVRLPGGTVKETPRKNTGI
jgi:hypothetical protein